MSDIYKSAQRHSGGLPGKELNDQPLKFEKKFGHLAEIIGSKEGPVDSTLTRIKNE